jgi:hypothetical protein
MGAPKRKHPEQHEPAREPTKVEREAAEDRADAEQLTRDVAEWEAEGRPTVSHEEIKRRLGMK